MCLGERNIPLKKLGGKYSLRCESSLPLWKGTKSSQFRRRGSRFQTPPLPSSPGISILVSPDKSRRLIFHSEMTLEAPVCNLDGAESPPDDWNILEKRLGGALLFEKFFFLEH
ncbi:hypothetical protein CDAR_294541 [Caerostris darwini]|uniref:Uncharacterized protein n=1 Tax=Caerostris darwini TaxID=1538125 RepID=A0AAV4UKH5_9ARAC|nr:hypothetical protein CDAR_294541 [Caerostris darwini]